MVEARDPYAVALGALRRMAGEGRFQWGEAVVVKVVAAELQLSTTPVREALACMSGLGLIEHRRGHGYFYPSLTAADIIDLYDVEWTYVHGALTLHHRGAASLQEAVAALGSRTSLRLLFAAIVDHTGNEALSARHAGIVEQLSSPERTRLALEEDPDEAVARMTRAVALGDRDLLLELVVVHHRQRCGRAGEITRLLRREGGRRI